MNILKGARRIQYVGRVGLAIAAAMFAFGLITGLIAYFTGRVSFAILPAVFLCFYPAIFGTIFLVIGWIVEGFATPSNTESSAD
jgi:hypothetical protein